jgi:hypothetical protein
VSPRSSDSERGGVPVNYHEGAPHKSVLFCVDLGNQSRAQHRNTGMAPTESQNASSVVPKCRYGSSPRLYSRAPLPIASSNTGMAPTESQNASSVVPKCRYGSSPRLYSRAPLPIANFAAFAQQRQSAGSPPSIGRHVCRYCASPAVAPTLHEPPNLPRHPTLSRVHFADIVPAQRQRQPRMSRPTCLP